MAISYNNPDALPQGYGTSAGTVNGVGSYGQHNILSSIDALPPDVSTKLFKRFGGQGLDILNLLIAQGAKRVVNNSNGAFHFEEDRYNQSVAVGSLGTNGATTVTFEILAADGLDTTNPYVVAGDLLIRMTDMRRLRVSEVSSKDATNATVEAVVIDGGGAITLTTSDEFGIYSSSFGEDTAQPDAKATYWSRFYAPMQRHKTSAKITGDALTDKVYPVMMDDGKTLKGFHSHLFAQHEYRHLLGLVGAMILGKGNPDPASNPSMGSFDNSSYAQGMVETFQNRAVTEQWTSGSFDVQDLYNMIAGMKANWTGNDLIGLFCKNLYQSFEQDISAGNSNFLANTNIASTRQESAKVIFGDNQDFETMMSTFAFSTLTLNGKNLNVKSFDLSYDPTLFGLGTNTNDFTNMGFVMPAEKQADASGLLRNTVELIYKSMDGEDRFMKVWDDGAASPRRLGPNDNYVIYMLTHFGFDWFKIEQCGLLYV
jgi:hypothetical protein